MLARSREEQRDIQIIERDLTSDLANQFNQRIDLEGILRLTVERLMAQNA